MKNNVLQPDDLVKTISWEFQGHQLDLRIIYVNRGTSIKSLVDTNKDYIPQPGDKIFFMPGCTVPRMKIKNFYKKYKVSGTNNIDSANIIITSSSSYHELVSHETKFMIPMTIFKEFVAEMAPETDLEPFLELCSTDYILCSWSGHHVLKGTSTMFGKKYEKFHQDLPASYFNIVTDDNYNKFVKLSTHNLCYDQDVILKRLNSVLIDASMFDTLSNMFKSTDEENHIIAMETMSNSDFEKSAVYLLLLMKEFKSTMYNCRVKNHVNFKSMLNFFNVNLNYTMSLDDVLGILNNKKLLTKENTDVLLPLATEQIIGENSLDYFQITTVALRSDVQETIDSQAGYIIETPEDSQMAEDLEDDEDEEDEYDLNEGLNEETDEDGEDEDGSTEIVELDISEEITEDIKLEEDTSLITDFDDDIVFPDEPIIEI